MKEATTKRPTKVQIKEQLLQNGKKLRPVSKGQLEFTKKIAAKYLFILDKSGRCKCQACEKESVITGTKHNGKAICPECGREMNVHHVWRTKYDYKTEVIKWTVSAKALDNQSMVLRFVLAYSTGSEMLTVEERARFYIHELLAEPVYQTFESDYTYDAQKDIVKHNKPYWKNGKGTYFRAPSYMTPNRFECYNAIEYAPKFFYNCSKLDCFKYYPIKEHYMPNHYSTQMHYQVRSARVNEKLEKAGFKELAKWHFNYYYNNGDRTYGNIDLTQTSLIKMLKLDSKRFEMLKERQEFSFLRFLQANKTIDDELWECANHETGSYGRLKTIKDKCGVSSGKVVKYVAQKSLDTSKYSISRTHVYEWEHYLYCLEELGYDLKDTYYSMPKDFRKADKKISKEYQALLDKREAEKEEERLRQLALQDKSRNEKIAKISSALRKLPELAELLNGSNGFLVYVPETADELRREGMALHNCLGTYPDRVADGKTIIFFIRRLKDKDAPFVAMEYCNGEVIQCMYNHNEPVKHNTKIYHLAQNIASVLKKNNILAA